MPIKVLDTVLPEVKIIEPEVYGDHRGFFMESWNARDFSKALGEVRFVQDCHSKSTKGVIRGLHYQLAPYTQAKLVRCIEGTVYDVVVDIRKDSPRFKAWFGIELSARNFRQLWIPEGFAHGFAVMTESAQVFYKTTQFWYPEYERVIAWNDPDLAIDWPIAETPNLSEKDLKGVRLSLADLL
ncbi:MAG TPA: dTDP-4-dehydrorhamnose 3,5-epimerase [Candidatus Aphodousia faecipullorum]|nr:dTDP-4-dehydrorhamnose 3,5-epimerase [Candidatus Aphodousia faecipullorum]